MNKKWILPLCLLGGFSLPALASCDAASGHRFFNQKQDGKCAAPSALQAEGPAANSPVLKPDDFSGEKDTRWDAPVEQQHDPDVKRINELVKTAQGFGEEALSTLNSTIYGAGKTKRNNSLNNEVSDVWCINKDKMLSENMRGWADKARWSVKWQAEYDYPIVSSFCVSGPFTQAISSVMRNYASTQQILSLDLYPKQSIAIVTSK